MHLKDYQILSKLGAGSFGIVYKAKRKDNGQVCVVKEVEMKAMDRKMKQWAMNEVKIMKTINSPQIVQYQHSFIEKEKLYICMQYCSGGDLAQFMKGQMGKPLAENTVWRFALQIMLGLRELHKKKILHRDIKTMNIFITHNKQIRIGDLGVARTLTGDFANTVVGTPYYLSPEMCEEKPYNEKTDVWAMGCLIYELCTGRHPFEGNSQAALALKIVVGKYSPIPTHYSPVTSWVIRSCLSVDYKRRPTIQYILSQPDVIKMANKLNISLQPPKVELDKVEIKVKEVVPQPVQKIIKGQVKYNAPRVGDIKVMPKKNHPPREPEKKSIERNKSKSSLQRFNKSGERNNRSMDRNKPNNPVYGAKRPSLAPGVPKGMPKKSNGFDAKKPEPKVREREPTPRQKYSKQAEVKIVIQKIMQPKVTNEQVKPQKISPLLNQKDQEVKKEETPIQMPPPTLLDKPRKSAQQLVDDDQLFKDFGITPEKLVVIEEKVEFKRINNIDWNIGEESQQKTETKTNQKTHFKELPTIRTDSNCGLSEVECKQIQDYDGVAEQIDDNLPYDSNQDIRIEDSDGEESLLIEPETSIEQDDELKRREKLLLLEKRIHQNEKRKKELVSLKEQGEKELLVKMDKSKLDKIISVINDGTDEDIQKVIQKQLNSAGGASRFYKIFYWQMEINRCEENINKCIENIKSIGQK